MKSNKKNKWPNTLKFLKMCGPHNHSNFNQDYNFNPDSMPGNIDLFPQKKLYMT